MTLKQILTGLKTYTKSKTNRRRSFQTLIYKLSEESGENNNMKLYEYKFMDINYEDTGFIVLSTKKKQKRKQA